MFFLLKKILKKKCLALFSKQWIYNCFIRPKKNLILTAKYMVIIEILFEYFCIFVGGDNKGLILNYFITGASTRSVAN